MKKELSHDYHVYKQEYPHNNNNNNNNMSGDQLLQVFNHQLVTSEQIQWNLSFGIPA